jgi:hypothetical protein
MDTELKVGDFAHVLNEYEARRIVISPNGLNYGYAKNEVVVLALGKDSQDYGNNVIRGNMYIKISPSKELIKDAKEKLTKSLLAERKANRKYIDNLTFIEISARLREYEQQI